MSGEKPGFEPKRRRLYGGARTNRGRPFERSRDLCFDFIDAEHGRRAFGVPGRRQGGRELVFIEFVEAAIPEDAVAARISCHLRDRRFRCPRRVRSETRPNIRHLYSSK